jgi:eukaryotic-like serine/threonine-protein kinase
MDGEAQALLGQVLDSKWEIIGHIDTSNFGHVFEGRRVPSGEPCAVKLLRAGRIQDATAIEDFQVEGDLLAMLAGCSNIIDLFDRGNHSISLTLQGPAGPQPFSIQLPYIVLELADVCLADLISRRHELPWSDRLALFREVVKGVHQMHQHQVVNRDIKSNNVLIIEAASSRVDAKIADLGRSSDTRTSERVNIQAYDFMRGDPGFSAPELIWGLGSAHPDTARLADLYLLGSVLFEFGAGVGLTAMVVPQPRGIINAVAALSGPDRGREYEANVPQLRQAFEVAYSQFEVELPGPIREQAMSLLRLLTDAEPQKREPKTMSGRPLTLNWDLQWLLRKVDNLLRRLDIEARRQAEIERKRERRHRRTTSSGTGKNA